MDEEGVVDEEGVAVVGDGAVDVEDEVGVVKDKMSPNSETVI